MSSECILACDVGGTRLRVAVAGPDGAVHSKRVIPTPRDDPGALARLMHEALDGADDAISGAVVGVPGPVNYAQGDVLVLPNLPGWQGHVTAERLSAELGLSVLLANDADLAALGEHRYGAGRGYGDMLYVTSSTGVGAGMVLGGRLLHGALSLAEVGHTIIDRATHGTVESLGSGTALARFAGDDSAAVSARALAGDTEAQELFAVVAKNFAIGVFNAVHCFSPQIVVIGGGMSEAGDLLLEPIRAMLERCGAICPASHALVVQAQGGDDVGLRGATAYWTESRGK